MILAVFDVDHTLLNGSAGGNFLKYLWQKKKLPWRNVYYLVKEIRRYRKGKLEEKNLVLLGARALNGLPESEVRELGKRCAEERLSHLIYRGAADAIARHLAEGHHVMLASGSPIYIIEPLARHLGIPDAIGSRPVVKDGICTKEVHEPVPFAEGKRDATLAKLDGMDVDLSQSWCYSDREIDLPLMEIVGHPVAVNPKPKLAAHAKEKGWQVEIWSRVRD